MTVGVINKALIASFVFNHPVGGMESVTLDISENNILPGKPFLVEISRLTVNITLIIHSNNCSLCNFFFFNLRTDRNMHLLIQDIQTESVHCTSSSISSVLASFFQTASSRNTSISLGGAPSGNIQVSRNNFKIDLSSCFIHAECAFLGSRKFHWLSQ